MHYTDLYATLQNESTTQTLQFLGQAKSALTEAHKAQRHCTMHLQNYVTGTAIQKNMLSQLFYISLSGSQTSFFCCCILDNLLNTEAHCLLEQRGVPGSPSRPE